MYFLSRHTKSPFKKLKRRKLNTLKKKKKESKEYINSKKKKEKNVVSARLECFTQNGQRAKNHRWKKWTKGGWLAQGVISFTALFRSALQKSAVQFSFPLEEYLRGEELSEGEGKGIHGVLSGHVIGRKRQKYAPIGRSSG